MVKNGFHSKGFQQLVVAAFLLIFVSPATSEISQTSARTQQRGTQPDHRLSAEEVARKYLPAVVLIVCDDANGNTVQASGFFISRGLIVTNYHVIEGMVRGRAKLAPLPGRKFTTLPIISILDFDRTEDLALLSINVKATSESGVPPSGLTPEVAELLAISKAAKGKTAPPRPPTTSSSDDPLGIDEFLENQSIPSLAPFNEPVKVGETIYVLGNPEGLEGSISEGIVSGVRQHGASRLIQITAAISPGSSGGPVMNTKGQVVGVVAASLTEGQNLNFAIASESVRKLTARFDQRAASSAPGAWTIPRDLPDPALDALFDSTPPTPEATPDSSAIERWRQGWQMIAGDDKSVMYYQPASVTKTVTRTITVWTKIVPKDLEAERKRKIASLTKSDPELASKYVNYAFDLHRLEIRCSTSEYRLLEFHDYTTDGDVLDSDKMNDREWQATVPHSRMDYLQAKVCQTPELTDATPTARPTPKPRIESLIDVSDTLMGGDSRTYRFHLDRIARVKGSFSARGDISVKITRAPMDYYSSNGELSSDSIDVSLWDGAYELVISARRRVRFSVNLTAYYPW